MEIDEEKLKTKVNRTQLASQPGLEQIEESNESAMRSGSRSSYHSSDFESKLSPKFESKSNYISHSVRTPKQEFKFSVTQRLGENITARVSEKTLANCLICFDNVPDAVFMECGHGGICYECSLELWKTTGECYLCRLVYFKHKIRK